MDEVLHGFAEFCKPFASTGLSVYLQADTSWDLLQLENLFWILLQITAGFFLFLADNWTVVLLQLHGFCLHHIRKVSL